LAIVHSLRRQPALRDWSIDTKLGGKPTPRGNPMPKRPSSSAELIEHEFTQANTSPLDQLAHAFSSTLDLWREFDSRKERETLASQMRMLRARLVDQASMALWYFAIQREVCGLRDLRHVLRDYRVPAEVIARMGVLEVKHQESVVRKHKSAKRGLS